MELSPSAKWVRQFVELYCKHERNPRFATFHIHGPSNSCALKSEKFTWRWGCYVLYGTDSRITYIGASKSLVKRLSFHLRPERQKILAGKGIPVSVEFDAILTPCCWEGFSFEEYLTRAWKDHWNADGVLSSQGSDARYVDRPPI